MSKRTIGLTLIPISTLVMLLVLIQYEDVIFDAFPDPFGKVGMVLLAIVVLMIDGGVVYLLARRFQREQEEEIYRRTGRRVEEWIDLLSRRGPSQQEAAINWMGMEHGLSEGDAAFVLAEKERRSGSQTRTDSSQRWILVGCVIGIALAAIAASGAIMALVVRGR